MPGKIFINYRRDDERVFAARIRDRLAGEFGSSNVFMDVDKLVAGQRFDHELEKALAQTDVFLAIIGPRWVQLLTARSEEGARDYVQEEISTALKREITTVPVLIERADLPKQSELPESCRELILHQKHVVTHEQFGRDVAGLIEAIKFARKATGASARPPFPASWVTASGGAAALIVSYVGAHVLGIPVPWPADPRSLSQTSVPKAVEQRQVRVAAPAPRRITSDSVQSIEGAVRVPTALNTLEAPKSLLLEEYKRGSGSGMYFVQISSQRSIEDASSSFHALQQKYEFLKDRQAKVIKADLGSRGVFYRVVLGPSTLEGANAFCSEFKRAGGQCIISRD